MNFAVVVVDLSVRADQDRRVAQSALFTLFDDAAGVDVALPFDGDGCQNLNGTAAEGFRSCRVVVEVVVSDAPQLGQNDQVDALGEPGQEVAYALESMRGGSRNRGSPVEPGLSSWVSFVPLDVRPFHGPQGGVEVFPHRLYRGLRITCRDRVGDGAVLDENLLLAGFIGHDDADTHPHLTVPQ